MQWSKPFVSILLFVVCMSVYIRCPSANRVENKTRWFGEKQHHETSQRKPNLWRFEGSTNNLVLSSEAERLKLESSKQRLHSTDSASVERKEHGLQSDILNRRVSKSKANISVSEFSNARKRIYEKMLQPSRRITKRTVDMSEPMQPIVSGQKSCSGRCMKSDTATWRGDETLACYCDAACYVIFNDCCSDYTQYCGVQKPNFWIKKFTWTCESFGHFTSKQHCEIGEGLWMISRCAYNWPYDEIRSNCENPTKFLQQASDIKRCIPVAIVGGPTFQNYFCMRCNNFSSDFEYFPVEIKTNDSSKSCQGNWILPKLFGQFYVHAWLEPPQNSQNNSFTPNEFQESLADYLNIFQRQLSGVNITTVLQSKTTTLFFYLVSSTVTLTSQQHSELLLTSRNGNTSSSETKLLNYLYFSEPFILQIKGFFYTVTKTTSRPLACVKETTYTPDEYTLNHDQEQVFVSSTNKTYEKFEYYWKNFEKHDVKRGNITVCEKYTPAKCNGSIIHYTIDEYSKTVNFSIYLKKTSSLYHNGEFENQTNKSGATCPPLGGTCILSNAHHTIRDNKSLGYITFIFFLLSILFLIFLLVTYILFPQLRTLPGKNLMNFAGSLLLFQVFWLPSSSTEVRLDKSTCMAMAIMKHYSLMASFVSMSVIAFHTCKVFARSLPAPKMSKGHERKLFCMYLALVWLLPGIFVAICVVLDDQDVVKLSYGESEICWLTDNSANTYFVTIPIAVLLLFNIITFVIAAVYLRKHSQNTAAKQASGNRRSNLSIYAKLSTLMGFTWLFGLLGIVVPSTTVFSYFFVIFTSLQGVFVAMAFVVNAKTFGLYKQRYASGSSTHEANPKRRNVPTNIRQDTKL